MFLTSDDVVAAVVSILNAHQADLRAAIDPIEDFGAILPYMTDNVDVDMYPCLMVQPQTESSEWLGLPSIAQETYDLTIWGGVHFDDAEIRARVTRRLAGAVKAVLNQRTDPIDVAGKLIQLYFNDRVPIARIEYGRLATGQGVFVEGFAAYYSVNACFGIKDENE